MRVNNNKKVFDLSNMDNIIEPTNLFDFSNLVLSHPVGIQGGGYFTKIENSGKSLYIQTPKSLTRQGFVKTGKKYYCDLMFDTNSEIIVNWFENLEEKCRKLIYEKKNDWFQGTLEESDIETAFNSLLRVYKSGKFYLLRTYIKNNKDDNPLVKIYDETKSNLSINDITTDTEIISILEIQGIKFTSRNFQIEIELKQAMVLNNEPIFDNCLIKTNKNHISSTPLDKIVKENIFLSTSENEDHANEDNTIKDNAIEDILCDTVAEPTLTTSRPVEENDSFTIEFENLAEDIQENDDALKEISNADLNVDTNDLELILKKPNQVYLELYKEARKKAKTAKKNAILAYLEAKNIKNTYMVENSNDSDGEFDAEIDETSESELEGL